MHFWPFLSRSCRLICCPVGWLVVGCWARAALTIERLPTLFVYLYFYICIFLVFSEWWSDNPDSSQSLVFAVAVMYLYWSRPPVQSTRSFPQYPHISFHTSSVNVFPIQSAVISILKGDHHNFSYLLLVPLDKICDCKTKKCLQCLNQNKQTELHIQTWVFFRNQDSCENSYFTSFQKIGQF